MSTSTISQEQLDRIESKLDELLELGPLINEILSRQDAIVESKMEAAPRSTEPPVPRQIDPIWILQAKGIAAAGIPAGWYGDQGVPTCHHAGAVRLYLRYDSPEELQARIDVGCLCGGKIIVKSASGSTFESCENVARKQCWHKPTIVRDKQQFRINLWP